MDEQLRTLPDALAVVRRRWPIWVSFLLLGAAIGVALSLLQTPVYTSETSIKLASPVGQDGNTRTLDPEEVATEADVIVSDPVAADVIDRVGLDLTTEELTQDVTAEPVQDKQVVMVAVTWPDADRSARIANAFARSYRKLGQQRTEAAQTQLLDYYVGQLTPIKNRLQTLQSDLATASTAEQPAIQAQIDALVTRQTQLQALVLDASDPLRVNTNVDVLTKATAPSAPAQPSPVRSGILGGIIGLVLGLLVAFLRDRFDDVVRRGDDAGAALRTPVLGHIPRQDNAARGRVASLVDPHSAVAEAFRVLGTNVRFLLAAHGRPGTRTGSAQGVVLVASGSPDEGKTSIVANLAVTAARGGLRTIAVEADLRSPTMLPSFGIDAPRGLADALIEGGDLSAYLLDVGVDNLLVLPAGTIPPNPAELLGSAQAQRLWGELRSMADLVLVDSPPLLRVADAAELAEAADIVIVAARYRSTRAHELHATAERLQRVGATVSGVVVTGEPTGRGGSHAYGYGERPTPVKV